jgi:hypothetical protein
MATIDVVRNLNDPRFTHDEWTATILETHDLQTEIVILEARDEDDRVRSVAVKCMMFAQQLKGS